MPKDIINPFDEPTLLGPPVMRAAYSDRTAWLMSAMSELAYYQFEDDNKIIEMARELATMSEENDIKERLEEFLSGTVGGGNEEVLGKVLKVAGFDLIRTYNRSETQAFLAKKVGTEGGGMLVLAFRGTEMNPKDIHSDINAALKTLEGEEKVHSGFLKALSHVKAAIEEDLDACPGLPVYIAGHSLGGALAILATRLLASDSHGACYTFGGPRVGNSHVDDQIKTPIYRVVNAADLVPRVPPSFTVNILTILANLFHLTVVSSYLRRFKGYVHYGDMRYLNHVEPGLDDRFPGLVLHSNPSFPLRAVWVVRRWIATGGKAALSDHSISLYRRKLKAYALSRSKIGKAVALPRESPETDLEKQAQNATQTAEEELK